MQLPRRHNYLPRLQGMGQWAELATAAYSAYASEDEGGGGAVPQRTDISTATQIQVSPQISPVFTQQFQPSGSPVNAGAAMAPTGTVPQVGYLPGFDYASGMWPTGVPGIPTQGAGGFNVPPQVLMAGLALAGVLAFTTSKRKRTRRRR